jgi:hypothetical protein
MVEGQKKCLGMAGEEKIEEHDWRDDACQQNGERKMVIELQETIDRYAKKASEAVVDGPDRKQKVSGLTLVGVSAARASIERREVITQGANAQKGDKHRFRSALGAFQKACPAEVVKGAAEVVVH